MNEFISQFILESRDYIEQASAGLLALERQPDDAETLDSVFRAFHTLKGGASIVDFSAMERAVHAAEEVLSHARAGDERLVPELIEACLACLDQSSRWLDRMEASETVPPGADADAERIVERINAARGQQPIQPSVLPHANWADSLLLAHEAMRGSAKTALRFTPPSASFFQGEDPLSVVASVPGLLWLDLEPTDAWPTLDELDPFECMLTITALTSSSASVVAEHLRGHHQACEIVEFSTPQTRETQGLPDRARELVQAQIALLDAASSETLEGCVRSAGTVVTNVLRHYTAREAPHTLAASIDESLRARNVQALRAQIATLSQSMQVNSNADAVTSQVAPQASSHQELAIARTLRVEAERVDALVRLTGELTTVKNAIGHAIRLQQGGEHIAAGSLKDHHATLDHLVAELQRAVLAIRVLPLRTVLQRFPRVVREMSAALGKQVKVSIEGEDTEADKAIVEMLFEPLLHIVRNAMDHGIEPANVRQRTGKPDLATIRMRASRHGAAVMIEVQDDGGGVDLDRVRQVALDRGVASTETLQSMSDAEILQLVFAPGFSTASRVTELSGRGVGMDAVRGTVERVGGRVSIDSHAGRGTTVMLTLPFSVMMTHVMTVEAGGQMFGIPLDAVVETLRVPTRNIVGVGAAKALVHRDRTIPIVELSKVLSVQGSDQSAADEAVIVIAAIAGSLGGLQVDRLGERMEVMLKPLEGLLAEVGGLTGTTILGDGRVLLVLDLGGVLQ